MLEFLLVLNLWANSCLGRDERTDILNAHRQEHLVLQNRAPYDKLHEVVFAVRQRNTENIESELIERSTPESSRYQKWMTFEEVGDYTSNLHGAKAIRKWLSLSNATVTWESLHSDYIKATAPVRTWEHLFSTTFHEWEDKGRTEETSGRPSSTANEAADKPPSLILAKEYTIPAHMRPHVETVFNTVQVQRNTVVILASCTSLSTSVIDINIFVRSHPQC